MPAAEIRWPLSSAPGVEAVESAGRLLNMYCEMVPTREQRPIWRSSPGLTRRANIETHSHCRGLFPFGTTLFVVLDERLWKLTASGTTYTATNLGALAGSDQVTIARNNKSPTADVMLVCEAGIFTLTTGGAPSSFSDADLPGSPVCVEGHNGYFLFGYGNGRVYATDLNDTAVTANAFTTAQQRPDGLRALRSFAGEVFAFGDASIEVYTDAGTTPFPMRYVTMIPRGIIGTFAVAGTEVGSVNILTFVGEDGIVYRLNGYRPDRISTHSLERAIAALDADERLNLQAFVTMTAGHAFWHLSSSTWTWVYDFTTGLWHERSTGIGVNRWRGSCSAWFNNEWLVGDFETGQVFAVSEAAQRDHDEQIRWIIESENAAAFPGRVVIWRSDFWFTAGVGIASGDDPIQTDPRVAISWSNDGGRSWGSPLLRGIGAQGEGKKQVSVLRTGMASSYGRRWRIAGADPVHTAFHGGMMATEGRAA